VAAQRPPPAERRGVTLWRYILRVYLRSLAAVFAVITLILMLFGFVENLRRFSGTEARSADVFRISIWQAPEPLYQAFPLVVMLASLVTFLRFARTSELVVMRAAGVSAIRLIAVPVAASVLLGAAMVAAVNPFVAASIKQGIAAEDEFRRAGASLLSFSSEGLWLRQADIGNDRRPNGGQTVIQAARANADGTALSGLRLHRFDADGQLFARIDAQEMRLGPGAWSIEGPRLWEAGADGQFERVETGGRLLLPTELTSDQILDSFSPPETVGFWALGRFIAQMEQSGFSGQRHRLFLQSELAKPLLLAAMVLIGAAFALRPSRFGQVGVMILFAILAGFSLYFLKDFAETLGARGQIPLVIAAWTPPVAAILLALGLLLHLEDG
jgi:lipopolysaccharide export system permease protein